MRSTDLPFNSRVFLPNQQTEEVEVEIQSLKMRLEAVMMDYLKDKKSKHKNIIEPQRKGINRLIKRRSEGDVVVYQTDKSSRLAVDAADNYIRSMQAHIEGDEGGKQQRTLSMHIRSAG